MGPDQDLLPGRLGHGGVTAVDNRLFLPRYRSGMPWRDLPERFGDCEAVHTRFTHWTKACVRKRVFEHLTEDADNE
jgi:transposase